jgi:DNA-binding MarR family transcriptional regulator
MLNRVASAVSGRVAATLAEQGLTLDQWLVLRALAEAGPQTMTGLTRETGITGPTLSRVVDRLVERALLYRNVDADDRRRVVVHVAERGCGLVDQLAPSIAEAERDGLSPLSAREARTLRDLLARIGSA